MLNKLYDLISSKKYTIGQYTVEVLSQISEGGFAYIYKVKDANSGQCYAMKKILLQVNYSFRMKNKSKPLKVK